MRQDQINANQSQAALYGTIQSIYVTGNGEGVNVENARSVSRGQRVRMGSFQFRPVRGLAAKHYGDNYLGLAVESVL
jgi:hypothetical protein